MTETWKPSRPANDHQPAAGQSGADADHTLWSRELLIPLVRYLARRAAAEDFEKAANDNRRSSKTRRKE
ncbi:MAG: hypothetical protein HC871_08380 [Rhizobiales bacterium]|nr:hypothetical protein [Hyphomicrobiales bacterium]